MSDAAEVRAKAIREAHPRVIEELIEEAVFIGNNLLFGQRNKRQHVARIATQFSEFIKPLTACRNECSYCCHQAVAITTEEAALITEYTRIEPTPVTFDPYTFVMQSGYQAKYTGVPCSFLHNGKCIVYPVRPMACRLHHSLEDSPKSCDTSSVQETGVFNVMAIHNAYINGTGLESGKSQLADIREFFPASVVLTNRSTNEATEPAGN